jgi:4-amino-4-deoxy-L-arabinose transferase-like glycosyltransferase
VIPFLQTLAGETLLSRRFRRWLWGIVFLGFVLRLAALALIYPSQPVDEEAIYSHRAIAWNEALIPPVDDERAPAALFVYRALVLMFGEDLTMLRFANVLLGTLFLPLLHAWTRRVAGDKIALTATFLAAVHPELVFYSASMWNENLYLIVLYALFLLYLQVERPATFLQAALLGILLGLTALTREIGVFLVPLVLLTLLLPVRSFPQRSSMTTLLCLVVFVLTILPWSIHISKRAERPVLITEMNTRRLFIGNVELPPSETKRNVIAARHTYGHRAYRELSPDPQERQELAKEVIWDSIRKKMPWWPIQKPSQEICNFFTPNSFPAARLFAHPEDPGYGSRRAYRFSIPQLDRRQVGLTLGLLTIAFHVATTLAGSAGLALLPLGRAAYPILVLGFMHIAPTLVTTACSRYRIPVTPLWILGAAALLVQGRHLWKKAGPGRRIAACAALLLTAAIMAQRIHAIFPAQYG